MTYIFIMTLKTLTFRDCGMNFSMRYKEAPPLFIIFPKNGWPIYGYERIKLFPELDEWLHAHYTLDREREAYRLYKRKEG